MARKHLNDQNGPEQPQRKIKSAYRRNNNKNEDACGGSVDVVLSEWRGETQEYGQCIWTTEGKWIFFSSINVQQCASMWVWLVCCYDIQLFCMLFCISLTVFLLTFSGVAIFKGIIYSNGILKINSAVKQIQFKCSLKNTLTKGVHVYVSYKHDSMPMPFNSMLFNCQIQFNWQMWTLSMGNE